MIDDTANESGPDLPSRDLQDSEYPPPVSPGQGVALSGQQAALHLVLMKEDEALGSMYLGALMVLDQSGNPDVVALASHNLRELMEKLERKRYTEATGAKSTQQYALKQRVQELRGAWKLPMEDQKWPGDPPWDITTCQSISRLVKKTRTFLREFEQSRPRRQEQTRDLLRSLDEIDQPLPGAIEVLREKEWQECREFFVRVAHHDCRASPEEFRKWLPVLERFLLDRMQPRTFDDHKELDHLIREAEANDKS